MLRNPRSGVGLPLCRTSLLYRSRPSASHQLEDGSGRVIGSTGITKGSAALFDLKQTGIVPCKMELQLEIQSALRGQSVGTISDVLSGAGYSAEDAIPIPWQMTDALGAAPFVSDAWDCTP